MASRQQRIWIFASRPRHWRRIKWSRSVTATSWTRWGSPLPFPILFTYRLSVPRVLATSACNRLLLKERSAAPRLPLLRTSPLAIPFKRVATSVAPIVTLSATADAQEDLTIEWTDANGGIGHL